LRANTWGLGATHTSGGRLRHAQQLKDEREEPASTCLRPTSVKLELAVPLIPLDRIRARVPDAGHTAAPAQ
jgi:hypothetical protein